MFISHKWRDDNSVCEEAVLLAETLDATGVDVVFDLWWPEEQGKDLEWHISQLAISRTVFFILTPEYFKHTSFAKGAERFRATWVEDELYFVNNLYEQQLKKFPDIGAVIDLTGLLFDPHQNPTPCFSRLFDVSTSEQWGNFLASFNGLRVCSLSQSYQLFISTEAREHANAFLSGRQENAFSALAELAGKFPFVGDLAIMLVKMAREVGDFVVAREVAKTGTMNTEDWRWEHRWLKAQWQSLQ